MVLFIAKRGQHNIGAKTHIQALREIYGSENVYEVDLFSKDSKETDHYISREVLAIVAGYKIPLKKKKEGEKE